MDLSLDNVPRLPGRVVVCPDVSGSMHWPVTGTRRGAISATRCVDAAALVAAAFLRRNRDTLVLPFEHQVVDLNLSPEATVIENASRLATIGGFRDAVFDLFAHFTQGRIQTDHWVGLIERQQEAAA